MPNKDRINKKVENKKLRIHKLYKKKPYINFSVENQTVQGELPVYELKKVVFRSNSKVTGNTKEVKQATLVFECSEFAGCEDIDFNSLVVKRKFKGKKKWSKNLVKKYGDRTERREPVQGSIEQAADFSDLPEFVARSLQAGTPSQNTTVNGSNGELLITVPAREVINSDKPRANVTFSFTAQGESARGSNTVGNTQGSNNDNQDGGCTTHQDCPEGQACSSGGQCRDGCRDHDDCPNGYCEYEKCWECRNDSHCPDGQYCNSGSCKECREHGHCPDGVCNSNTGECEEGECFWSRDCGCGEMCRDNTCVNERDNGEPICQFYQQEECPNDCPEGQKCVFPNECLDEQLCNGNNQECPEGKCCGDDNLCSEDCECKSDFDCNFTNGEVCEDGECVPGCFDDTNCPHCEVCTNRQCERITDESGNEVECPPGCDTPGFTCTTGNGGSGICCDDNLCRPEGECPTTEPTPTPTPEPTATPTPTIGDECEGGLIYQRSRTGGLVPHCPEVF